MLSQWVRAVLMAGVLCGLCLPVRANTTMPTANMVRTATNTPPIMLAQTDLAMPVPGAGEQPSEPVRVALLLPLKSSTLRTAADAVRAGFRAAYEQDLDNIAITVIETDDSPQDGLTAYGTATAQHDIVVGPLSRTGVTAVAQSGVVSKPTIALTTPDNASADTMLPQRMLVMGLSIEDEARQVADWAAMEKTAKKAVVLFTKTIWQRRAAKAFETQWQQHGLEVEALELPASDGFLHGKSLIQLKKDLTPDAMPIFFLALDARQARQVRSILGREIALYGTSQLNPFALADRKAADLTTDMDGTRLLDIPWQLQPNHPAVMRYPRLSLNPGQKRNADLERLYALGVDAYRVAREIAMQQTSFEVDGVTGTLRVRFDQTGETHFERTMQQAVYRNGSVVPISNSR